MTVQNVPSNMNIGDASHQLVDVSFVDDSAVPMSSRDAPGLVAKLQCTARSDQGLPNSDNL